MKRGEIYYIQGPGTLGEKDVKLSRPGIIVTPDSLIGRLSKVQVVYLTNHTQEDLPTHVTIRATGQTSTALCELVTWVDKHRIGNWCGELSAQEQERLNAGLMISLGIEAEPVVVNTNHEGLTVQAVEEMIRLKGERDAYKSMVDSLIRGGRP